MAWFWSVLISESLGGPGKILFLIKADRYTSTQYGLFLPSAALNANHKSYSSVSYPVAAGLKHERKDKNIFKTANSNNTVTQTKTRGCLVVL